ncbi:DUF4956 domain-containing protein [Treponema sp.]|uniref:DUF4956 domain-containing protein n=1 Tax=Treponema sp. TaxID=166 RepID=UPI0025E5EE0E|nr:DUF4956 domain-containing protein [Treponema sp.]MCR5218410.1 DUF4956 domain-containing protein [Treponema sp.]
MKEILMGFVIRAEDVNIFFNMILGLVTGFIIACGYFLANHKRKFSKNFVITVFFLPVIMAVIIPFIASDLKKTLALAGVFALCRFRSIPGDSKDILYVFFAISSGLIVGLNSYFIGFSLVICVTVLYVLISRLWNDESKQILKITIPEDMNYKDVFNDIFAKYVVKYDVKNVKTSNMGTLITISYWFQPKKDIDTKAFIDELRTRNGNLNIIIENPEDMMVPVL